MGPPIFGRALPPLAAEQFSTRISAREPPSGVSLAMNFSGGVAEQYLFRRGAYRHRGSSKVVVVRAVPAHKTRGERDALEPSPCQVGYCKVNGMSNVNLRHELEPGVGKTMEGMSGKAEALVSAGRAGRRQDPLAQAIVAMAGARLIRL